jgi:alpha-1,3-rhamnosyltransferase
MQSNQPLVSMIVPSYNHAQYVQTCINSIIAQDYRNIELIVIDDGSTDESTRCIQEMVPACQARFSRFEFRSRPNKGLSATLDEGLSWAGGEYSASIASDDVLLPGKTSTLLRQIEGEPRVAGVFGGCELIDEKGVVMSTLRPSPDYYEFEDLFLRRKHFIVAPSQLLRVSALKEAGGFPSNLYIEDWYMWLNLTERGYRLKTVSDVLVQYRQHGLNISKNARKMYESRKLIVGQFKGQPTAKLASAKVSLMAAIDFASSSKRDSWTYLIEAVGLKPSVVFSRLFLGAFFRWLAPSSVLRALRSLRENYQRSVKNAKS